MTKKGAPKERECPDCAGTGFQKVKQPEQPGRQIYPARCSRCGGKGRIAEDDEWRCQHAPRSSQLPSS